MPIYFVVESIKKYRSVRDLIVWQVKYNTGGIIFQPLGIRIFLLFIIIATNIFAARTGSKEE